MLAALERAQDHAFGKAVLLHPLDRRNDAGDASADAADADDTAGTVDVADAPDHVGIADIADAAGNDHTAARRVVAAVRALLADTVVKETRSEALDAVNCGTWTRWTTCASTPS